ncbi:MAG: NTP transferase domain-containing protein [Kofleriaceae bacterium]|nr:NTP transferase domain-containing protein [Kofleriaceae bacterium]
MNELERIVREAKQLAEACEPYLLATVVRVAGSSYRRPGARMLVSGDRWIAGCVSGGCLEGDVRLRGEHRAKDGAVIATYDSAADDGEPFAAGLGCGGVVDVLLEHVPVGAANDALAFAAACFADELPGTLVTVIRSSVPSVPVGARVAVGPAIAFAVPVADPASQRALEALAHGPAGVVELAELGLTALVENIVPSPQLFVLGSGHDAAPVAAFATSIGMRVTVADRTVREPSRFLAATRVVSTQGTLDRVRKLVDAAAEPYVLVMHHHIPSDREALGMALASRARYIGVLGPLRRTRAMLAELGAADDPRVHAPVGLDLGAETPEQIALSIVAEIQAVAHCADARRLRDRARALHADVATIVLAAGDSRRLGSPKQLVRVQGEQLVRKVTRACLDARSGPVAVVLGSHVDEVAVALGALPVAHVINEAWAEGIASSIRAGVAWAETTSARAIQIVLGDQPLLASSHLSALRSAWLAGAPAVGSRYQGVVGAPALFDRSLWPELAGLAGDQGAGRLLRDSKVAAIDWEGGAVDVDTVEDVTMVSS